MGNMERYIETAKNTIGTVVDYHEYFPISLIWGNEDYYVRSTQFYLDAYEGMLNTDINIPDDLYDYDDKNYYSTLDIIDLARNFLSTLDEEYVKDFDEMVNTGHLIVTDPKDISNGDQLDTDDVGEYDRAFKSDLRNEVILPMHNRITDAEVLVHEFMHHELDKKADNSEDQAMLKIFHEMNSIFHEYMFYDYLNNNGLFDNDCRRQLLKRLYHTKLDAENINLDSKIMLIAKNRFPISELEFDHEKAYDIFRKLRESCFYFTGGAYGAVLYDRLKQCKINYKHVKNFIDALPKAGSDDRLLNYIFDNDELEFTDIEIKQSVNRIFYEFDLNSLNNKKVL